MGRDGARGGGGDRARKGGVLCGAQTEARAREALAAGAPQAERGAGRLELLERERERPGAGEACGERTPAAAARTRTRARDAQEPPAQARAVVRHGAGGRLAARRDAGGDGLDGAHAGADPRGVLPDRLRVRHGAQLRLLDRLRYSPPEEPLRCARRLLSWVFYHTIWLVLVN